MELYQRSVSVLAGPKGQEGRLIQNLRVTFDIEKSLEKSPNPAKIEIYNLTRLSRSVLEAKDSFVALSAGYNTQELGIFQGDVAKVTTKRSGADIITSIEAGDGELAYQNSSADLSFGPGVTAGQVFDSVLSTLGLSKGEQQGFDRNKQYVNGITLSGMSRDHLDVVLGKQGLQWSIQNGQLQILTPNGSLSQEAVVLTPKTGLIGTPFQTKVLRADLAKPKDGKIAQSGVKLVCLMNGNLVPGRLVKVDAEFVTGVFTIQKAHFRGDTHGQEFYVEVEAI